MGKNKNIFAFKFLMLIALLSRINNVLPLLTKLSMLWRNG